ncbi:SusE domain-containing protein [uncultured Pontibacter sp.]|uniref:SusE domain-containing protein n=1 Tax=uncultured Pontibacter sp. TaxID=453356 RepID=UPI00261E5432|nr:SusE domain-containing protein [uncultured Pontibacter sp.]
MKSWLNKSLLFFAASLALMSCEKDEDRLTVASDGSSTLTASTTSLNLSQETAQEEAVTFSWSPLSLTWSNPSLANKNAATYEIQIDQAGGDFTDPATAAVEGNLEKTYTVEDFNRILGNMELQPEQEASLDIRLKTMLGANKEPLYSNVITVTATPYVDLKEYPSLFVPGSYQGWSPESAPFVASVSDNNIYKGYFYFPDAVNNFKFTPERDWDEAHGDAGDGTTGNLVIAGGENIAVNGAGYYLITANLVNNTWSAKKTEWGVTGSATPNGWASETVADHNLEYDATEMVWKATLQLSEGAVKFRANDEWEINYGDTDPITGFLKEGGADIMVAEAGMYEIILNLSVGGNYRYKLIKQ